MVYIDECVPSVSTSASSVDVGRTSDEVALQEENRKLRDARLCRVCMDKETNTVFLPCGHFVCCETCAKSLSECPICRDVIRGTVRTFLS